MYGDPKVGKTSILKTIPLENDEDLLYLAVDPGQLAIRDRNFTKITTENNIWGTRELTEFYTWVLKNKSKYKWLVIDGLDDVAEAVLYERLQTNTNGQKAYGEMNAFMDRWIKNIRDIRGISTIFITHLERETDSSGNVSFKPAIPGRKVSSDINKYFDIIAAMRFVQEEDGVSRKLQLQREADIRYLTGDRTGSLSPLEPPSIAVLLDKIKTISPDKGMQEKKERAELLDTIKKIAKTSEKEKAKVKLSMEKFGVDKLATSELSQLQEIIKDLTNEQ